MAIAKARTHVRRASLFAVRIALAEETAHRNHLAERLANGGANSVVNLFLHLGGRFIESASRGLLRSSLANFALRGDLAKRW